MQNTASYDAQNGERKGKRKKRWSEQKEATGKKNRKRHTIVPDAERKSLYLRLSIRECARARARTHAITFWSSRPSYHRVRVIIPRSVPFCSSTLGPSGSPASFSLPPYALCLLTITLARLHRLRHKIRP